MRSTHCSAPNAGRRMKCSFAEAKLRQFGPAELQSSAIIEDPDEIRHIMRHLIKIGRAPPGLDTSRLN